MLAPLPPGDPVITASPDGLLLCYIIKLFTAAKLNMTKTDDNLAVILQATP
jgi:hypothetical protein